MLPDTKIACLVSGRGKNLEAIIQATQAPQYPATVVYVASDKPDAPALTYAQKAGIPTATIPFDSQFLPRLTQDLAAYHVQILALAGFMRVLPATWLTQIQKHVDAILNIHPSLLPAFPGLHTHRRALAAKVQTHGCSVHYVTEDLDQGPILAQKVLYLQSATPYTEITLAQSVLQLERALYPQVIAKVARQLNTRPNS